MERKRLTRIKAAKMLNVTPSTISNYVQKRMLSGYIEQGTLYVDKQSLEKYRDSLIKIEADEKALENKLLEIKMLNEKADQELIELRDGILPDRKQVRLSCIVPLVESMSDVSSINSLTDRDMQMLKSFLKDGKYAISNLAKEYSLTRERVRQIIMHAFKHFLLQVDELKGILVDNAQLKQENAMLKKHLGSLQIICDELRQTHKDRETFSPEEIEEPSIYNASIHSLRISTRILCVFRLAGVLSIKDILTKFSCKEDFLRYRNFGNKCLYELGEALEEEGLVFKEKNESMPHFLARLNISIKNKQTEQNNE